MNRTNNIFELLTVDPVLHDRQAGHEPERSCNELMLLDDLDQLEEKNLRLKGRETVEKIVRVWAHISNFWVCFRSNDLHG